MKTLTNKKIALLSPRNSLLFLVLAVLSCQDPGNGTPDQGQPAVTRVIVKLDGVPATVDAIRVNVSLDGTPSAKNPVQFDKQLSQFFLDFTEPKNQGTAIINVDAFSQQCYIASGRGQVTLAGEPTVELTIPLTQNTSVSCFLTVKVVGPGKVTSTPSGIDCGQQCSQLVPVGTAVTLNPMPDVGGAPFAWDGACTGSGACSVTVNSGVSVSADFSPKVCTQSSWCWENPRPQGNNLAAAWIAPDQTLFAVGDRGTILIRKGINWVSSASGTSQNLHGVWGSSYSDIYAAGDQGTLLHWDGTRWTTVNSTTTQNLYAVHGSGPNDVWVTGDQGTILHGVAGAFTPVSGTGLTGRPATAAWAFSPTDVWLAAWGAVAHWNGTAWATYTNGFRDINGKVSLYGNSSADVLAVDYGGNTLRWNGTAWNTINQTPQNYYNAVWGVSTNTIWAAGRNLTSQGLIWRWNGSQWQTDTAPAAAGLNGLFGLNATSIVAVGEQGTVMGFDGTQWTNQGGQSVYQQFMYGVWVNTATDLWGAGAGGMVWRGNGLGWTIQDTGAKRTLNGIWGSAGDDVWSVGDIGTIVRWNGQNWTTYPAPDSSALQDVKGTGPNDIWAVGQTVLRWTGGQAWSKMSPQPPTSSLLQGLYIAGSTVYVCGQGGIFSWDGTQWRQEATANCEAIHGIGTDTIYAVGTSPNSVMKRNSSGKWDSIDLPAVRLMHSVYVAAPNDVWVVGGNSTSVMAHFDGSAWATIDSGMAAVARRITGLDTKNLWLVGDQGAILRQRR